MRIKNILTVCLMLVSLLVLIGLLNGHNVWVGIVCYWAVLLMKNITDYRDIRREERHEG